MTAHILDTYTFDWNPDELTIPESKKIVAEAKTHDGSEIFQWDAIIKGEKIVMIWKLMSIAQYNELRTLYLSPDTVVWNPQYNAVTYNVIVTGLQGKYSHVHLDDLPYRTDVELTLSIRSIV